VRGFDTRVLAHLMKIASHGIWEEWQLHSHLNQTQTIFVKTKMEATTMTAATATAMTGHKLRKLIQDKFSYLPLRINTAKCLKKYGNFEWEIIGETPYVCATIILRELEETKIQDWIRNLLQNVSISSRFHLRIYWSMTTEEAFKKAEEEKMKQKEEEEKVEQENKKRKRMEEDYAELFPKTRYAISSTTREYSDLCFYDTFENCIRLYHKVHRDPDACDIKHIKLYSLIFVV
jgi:hypothetical protein